MHLLLVPTAAGFDYRASGGSKLGPFTATGGSSFRTRARRRSSHCRARRRRSARQRRPALRSGRLHRPAGARRRRRSTGTLDFAPVGGAPAHRRAPQRRQRQLPGRPRRSAAGRLDGTIILADGRTTVDGTLDARGVERAGSRWPGSPPTPGWSTAAARSAPRSPAAAAPISPFDASPTSRPTRSG